MSGEGENMKVKMTKVLLWVDEPVLVLFDSESGRGDKILANAVPEWSVDDGRVAYFGVNVKEGDLREFFESKVCLRTLMLNARVAWIVYEDTMEAHLLYGAAKEDWLPEAGFYWSDVEGTGGVADAEEVLDGNREEGDTGQGGRVVEAPAAVRQASVLATGARLVEEGGEEGGRAEPLTAEQLRYIETHTHDSRDVPGLLATIDALEAVVEAAGHCARIWRDALNREEGDGMRVLDSPEDQRRLVDLEKALAASSVGAPRKAQDAQEQGAE